MHKKKTTIKEFISIQNEIKVLQEKISAKQIKLNTIFKTIQKEIPVHGIDLVFEHEELLYSIKSDNEGNCFAEPVFKFDKN